MTESSVRQHVLFALGLTVGTVLVVLLLGRLVNVWLLAFGGVLLAVALHGVGAWLGERSPLPTTVTTALVCTVFFGLAGAGVWMLGPAFVDGLVELRTQLPAALERAREFVTSRPQLDQLFQEASAKASSLAPGSKLLGKIGDVFSTAVSFLSTLGSALAGVLVITVVSVYGALNPSAYTGALLVVLPERHQPRAREILSALAHALRWWLVGRICSMIVVGVLSWIGLVLLDLPSAGTLAILAALLSFIPNIGPVVSAVPAILVGLGESPTTALYVVGLYALVQMVESYIVTPLIQQRVVALPPAIIIVVQLAFGSVLGLLGLLFATPLAVVAMVLTKKLWIEGTLGRKVDA